MLEDLSDLIEELDDIVSDNEIPVVSNKLDMQAIKASQPKHAIPFNVPKSQHLSPIKEAQEESSINPFGLSGLKTSDIREYSLSEIPLENIEDLICAPDSSSDVSDVSDEIGALI